MTDEEVAKLDWKKKEIHLLREEGFCIEIVHWTSPPYPQLGTGANHWNVYVYLFPTHPLLKTLHGSSSHDYDRVDELPFHRGCTWYEPSYDKDGKLKSVCAGSDYSHAGDEEFSFQASIPSKVTEDALELYSYVKKLKEEADAGA